MVNTLRQTKRKTNSGKATTVTKMSTCTRQGVQGARWRWPGLCGIEPLWQKVTSTAKPYDGDE